MAVQWKNPSTASVRISVAIDADGNIAAGDAAVAGAKSVTFSTVAAEVTAAQFLETPEDRLEGQPYGGTAYTFVAYLLGGEYDALATKRTIIQSVEEAA